jgi:twitching motility protein PilT
MNSIKTILQTMVQLGASDLYLRIKSRPRARIDGQVKDIFPDILSVDDINAIANALLMSELRKKIFFEKCDIDFVYGDPDIGRFRVNIFMQRGTPSIVARHVHTIIKTFEELNLPGDVCRRFCEETKGIFLVTGPAGNGKSTSIASMIEHINQTRFGHIITIEDPIEFLFQDKKCIINQRELGLDVPSYPAALKHVTQQSADVIYIGNIRDEETMRAAVTSAELGAFVVSTFHTVNCVQSIIRMLNFFPPHTHEEMRTQFSIILKGILAMRLIPRKDGNGRIPAVETMIVTPMVAKLIREGRIREIQHCIDGGETDGMTSFKKSLVRLVREGLISEEDGMKFADSKDDFLLELNGIQRGI